MYKYIGPNATESSRNMTILHRNDLYVIATDSKYLKELIDRDGRDIEIQSIKYKPEQFDKWYEKA